MPARRNKGSGSITWDETAQRWTARLDLGVGPNGRRVRVKATAPTKAEARRKLDRLQNEHQSGMDLTQRDVTVAELTELWLQRGLANTVTANTRANYTALLRTHVLPGIGARKVATLEPEHIEALLDHLAGKGYATRTLGLTLSLIRRVLTFGQRRRLVVRNVADLVQTPAGAPSKERTGLSVEQARALLEAARGERLGGLITLSLLLGLRPGEVAGLTWPMSTSTRLPRPCASSTPCAARPRAWSWSRPRRQVAGGPSPCRRFASTRFASRSRVRPRMRKPPGSSGPTPTDSCSPARPAPHSTRRTRVAPSTASPPRRAWSTCTRTSCGTPQPVCCRLLASVSKTSLTCLGTALPPSLRTSTAIPSTLCVTGTWP